MVSTRYVCLLFLLFLIPLLFSFSVEFRIELRASYWASAVLY